MATVMISEVYDALKEAGASEEKARKAAEAVASFEHRFSNIESTQRLHTWILTFNTGLLIAVVGKLFLVH